MPEPRPTLHLQLTSRDGRDGEIPLSELAKVAEQTQRVVSRIADRIVDRGNPRRGDLLSTTRLSLVGLRSGSTVLDIAAPDIDDGLLPLEATSSTLSELSFVIFVDTLDALRDEHPVLPIGVDSTVVQDLDAWLRPIRGYRRVMVSTDARDRQLRADVEPQQARRSLRSAETQASISYISASHQALAGRLYALNLNTGTFSIQDAAGHTIRLSVPEEIRSEAASLADRTVRAIGTASLDDHRRLRQFIVESLEETEPRFSQTEFFEIHHLPSPPPMAIRARDLSEGVLPDLSDAEVDAFVDSLRAG